MFEIKTNIFQQSYYIDDGRGNYLHCDGGVLRVCEYFESKENAQKVLDKFQPELKHEWKHGDVFMRKSETVMVYLVTHEMGPVVYLLDYSGPGKGIINACLGDAKFLFNIKEKL